MKNILCIITIMAVFVVAAVAGPGHFPNGLSVATVAQERASTNTVVSSGDLFVYDDAEIQDDLRVDGDFTLTGSFATTEPFISQVDTWDNLPAKSSVSICTSEVHITTATCIANKFYRIVANFVQPAFAARSLRFQFDGGTASSATVVTEGLNARGTRIVETGSVHSEIYETNNAFSVIYGSTLTFLIGGDATLELAVGTGDYVGLLGDIGATSDFYKATVQTSTTKADETTSVTVNAAYDTWTQADVPDGAYDFYIFYKVRGR